MKLKLHLYLRPALRDSVLDVSLKRGYNIKRRDKSLLYFRPAKRDSIDEGKPRMGQTSSPLTAFEDMVKESQRRKRCFFNKKIKIDRKHTEDGPLYILKFFERLKGERDGN